MAKAIKKDPKYFDKLRDEFKKCSDVERRKQIQKELDYFDYGCKF